MAHKHQKATLEHRIRNTVPDTVTQHEFPVREFQQQQMNKCNTMHQPIQIIVGGVCSITEQQHVPSIIADCTAI